MKLSFNEVDKIDLNSLEYLGTYCKDRIFKIGYVYYFLYKYYLVKIDMFDAPVNIKKFNSVVILNKDGIILYNSSDDIFPFFYVKNRLEYPNKISQFINNLTIIEAPDDIYKYYNNKIRILKIEKFLNDDLLST